MIVIIVVVIISLIAGALWACAIAASKADDINNNELATFKCEQCIYRQRCINAECNIHDCRQGYKSRWLQK